MSKKQKIWAVTGGAVAYLVIGSLLAIWLHDRVPLVLIMLVNYALAAMIFSPILPFVFDSRKETTSE